MVITTLQARPREFKGVPVHFWLQKVADNLWVDLRMPNELEYPLAPEAIQDRLTGSPEGYYYYNSGQRKVMLLEEGLPWLT